MGVFLAFGLLVAVVAEGGYILQTQRKMQALEKQVSELSSSARNAGPERPSGWGEAAPARDPGEGAPPPVHIPPPRFVAPPPDLTGSHVEHGGDNPLPLPPALDSPEARQQLRQFVDAQLARAKEEERDQQRQKREVNEQQTRDAMAKSLGLSPDESRRFNDVMASMQQARRDLREKIDSGQIPRESMGREFAALRDKSDQELRSVIGDGRMDQYRQLQRSNFGATGPGGGGGPGRWAGGGPGTGAGFGGFARP